MNFLYEYIVLEENYFTVISSIQTLCHHNLTTKLLFQTFDHVISIEAFHFDTSCNELTFNVTISLLDTNSNGTCKTLFL